MDAEKLISLSATDVFGLAKLCTDLPVLSPMEAEKKLKANGFGPDPASEQRQISIWRDGATMRSAAEEPVLSPETFAKTRKENAERARSLVSRQNATFYSDGSGLDLDLLCWSPTKGKGAAVECTFRARGTLDTEGVKAGIDEAGYQDDDRNKWPNLNKGGLRSAFFSDGVNGRLTAQTTQVCPSEQVSEVVGTMAPVITLAFFANAGSSND